MTSSESVMAKCEGILGDSQLVAVTSFFGWLILRTLVVFVRHLVGVVHEFVGPNGYGLCIVVWPLLLPGRAFRAGKIYGSADPAR